MAAAEPIDRLAIARELFPEQPEGFPYENFDLPHLKMPEDDDMGIPSDDDDVDVEEVETETGFGSVVGMLTSPRSSHIAQQHWSKH